MRTILGHLQRNMFPLSKLQTRFRTIQAQPSYLLLVGTTLFLSAIDFLQRNLFTMLHRTTYSKKLLISLRKRSILRLDTLTTVKEFFVTKFVEKLIEIHSKFLILSNQSNIFKQMIPINFFLYFKI